MKLSEFIKTLPKKRKIKIGAAGGTSWFYVGTASDFDKNMSVYSVMAEMYSADSIQRGEIAYRTAANAKVSPLDYCMRYMHDRKKEFSFEDYQRFLESHFQLMNRRKERYNLIRERRREYVQLQDREVRESFEADPAIEEDVLSILIEGYEFGKYWTFSEAESVPSMKLASFAEEGGEGIDEGGDSGGQEEDV